MSKVENRLWSDLAVLQEAGVATVKPPAPSRWRFGRVSLIAAGVVSVAAASAASVILGIGSAAPAYAVTANSDGTITITLNELVGATGANAQLVQLSAAVRVVKVESGCSAALPNERGVNFNPDEAVALSGSGGSATVRPAVIPSGDTVLVTAQEIDGHIAEGVAVVRGTAPACVPPATQEKGAPLE